MTEELLDDWHPLDGVPAPEFIPYDWTPEHLGTRVVGAFLVLRMDPSARVKLPAGLKTAWPVYELSAEDLYAQREQAAIEAAEAAKLGRGGARPSARFTPSAAQLTQADLVFGWLLTLGAIDPVASAALCAWGHDRALGEEAPQGRYGAEAIGRGLRAISGRLNAIGAAVF